LRAVHLWATTRCGNTIGEQGELLTRGLARAVRLCNQRQHTRLKRCVGVCVLDQQKGRIRAILSHDRTAEPTTVTHHYSEPLRILSIDSCQASNECVVWLPARPECGGKLLTDSLVRRDSAKQLRSECGIRR